MSEFADFERVVVSKLVGPHMQLDDLAAVVADAKLVSIEHTGGGYFLTVRHPAISAARVVCHEPMLVGQCDGVDCGFVVFLEDGELTLECHSWGDDAFPTDVRERPVRVEEAA